MLFGVIRLLIDRHLARSDASTPVLRNRPGITPYAMRQTPAANSIRSGVIPSTKAALPPTTDQAIGTKKSDRGTGVAPVSSTPAVKRVVGQGTANSGALGNWWPVSLSLITHLTLPTTPYV
jgi:hypothetical protein